MSRLLDPNLVQTCPPAPSNPGILTDVMAEFSVPRLSADTPCHVWENVSQLTLPRVRGLLIQLNFLSENRWSWNRFTHHSFTEGWLLPMVAYTVKDKVSDCFASSSLFLSTVGSCCLVPGLSAFLFVCLWWTWSDLTSQRLDTWSLAQFYRYQQMLLGNRLNTSACNVLKSICRYCLQGQD